jgi:hypothetical protein
MGFNALSFGRQGRLNLLEHVSEVNPTVEILSGQKGACQPEKSTIFLEQAVE